MPPAQEVLALAAADSHPLIDLDSTIFLQLVLFLIVYAVLSRVLFKPYLKVRKERQEGIEGAREKAKHMEEEAAAKIAEYESQIGKARLEANKERLKVRAEATAHEQEISATTRQRVQKTLDEARARLASEAARARADIQPRVQEIGREIAQRILGREVA